ncbi:hypothetical protein L3081_24285 [Colwellia sp. MSW7]|uniref:Uncharacterized protein n=1 Tax=Colwellia maritima TaxID=2912588 RepID=A0ABS9X6T4_9GAMM|nr:hypothetical protein [Colwellia maritima]MCI2285948.1 hypothetical protein [Colwellia maritima]
MKLLPIVVFIVVGIWIGSAYPEIGEMVLSNVKSGIEYISRLLSNTRSH